MEKKCFSNRAHWKWFLRNRQTIAKKKVFTVPYERMIRSRKMCGFWYFFHKSKTAPCQFSNARNISHRYSRFRGAFFQLISFHCCHSIVVPFQWIHFSYLWLLLLCDFFLLFARLFASQGKISLEKRRTCVLLRSTWDGWFRWKLSTNEDDDALFIWPWPMLI